LIKSKLTHAHNPIYLAKIERILCKYRGKTVQNVFLNKKLERDVEFYNTNSQNFRQKLWINCLIIEKKFTQLLNSLVIILKKPRFIFVYPLEQRPTSFYKQKLQHLEKM